MSQHPIDDLFKGRIEGFSEPQVPAHLWEGVATGVQSHRNWRQIGTFSLLGLFFLLYTTAFLFLPLESDKNNVLPKEPISSSYLPVVSQESGGEEPVIVESVLAEVDQSEKLKKISDVDSGSDLDIRKSMSVSQNAQLPYLNRPLSLEFNQKPTLAMIEPPSKRVEELDLLESSIAVVYDEQPKVSTFEARPRWRKSLAVGFGAQLANKTFKAKSPEFKSYQQNRAASELPLNGFGLMVDFALTHHSGLMLKAGLEYEHAVDQFDQLLSEKEEWVISENTQTGQLDSSLQIVRTFDTYTNRYHFVNLPIMVGYEWGTGRWRINTSAGLLLNMVRKAEGMIYDPEGDSTLDIVSLEKPGIIRSAGLQFGGTFGINLWYRLIPGFDVGINPTMNWYPQSFTTKDFPVSQTYSTYQFRLGIRKHF